ncbi:MAG: 50S ribosomal protein L5 [Deltaproteobacteria bacterium]|nr:50S ribosomal protein L5 [Deltaproteobacteria bacterium]MBI2500801.1 50S ribosomal protein L5 [Deltaproteobacteria bacterium]MBI4196467.1 50S ribosomal protein L5 [Deltaproteobacteria bacterium]
MTFEEIYKKKCIPELMKQLGVKNTMAVPRLEKIVVSSCLKEAVQDKKVLDKAVEELGLITGQKAVIAKARKSIANFKLRKGIPIGCRVVLRKKMMFEFLNRLINVVLPRTRDFHGISPKGFDGRGNYTFGITEQIVFPEINFDKIDKVRGMNVTIVTTAKTDEHGRALLRLLGMPFREN